MSIGRLQLNRSTLERQLLLGRQDLDAEDGVRKVVALQAQEPASPYLALWNRLAGFDPSQLDAAFADGRVVKSSLIRLTLHVVHSDDYRPFYRAMLPSLRDSRLNDRRYRSTGLTVDDADAIVAHLLDFVARPRAKGEVERMLEERLGRHEPRMFWALRMFAPMHHTPTGGPWAFQSPASFVAAPPGADSTDDIDPVQWMLLRYLEGFGPATIRDFEQFSILRRPVTKAAVEALGDRIETIEGPDGAVLLDLPGARIPDEETPAPPRLLPMWDNIFLAYFDRSRMIPPQYHRLVIRRNGDVLPTVLVDGHAAGVWRPVVDGIEVVAFHRLDDETWAGLEAEAHALVGFLAGREPMVYGRYAGVLAGVTGEVARVLGD